jgi:tetratricopeptide (TPR) repeat protein
MLGQTRIRVKLAERQAEGYLELGMPEHALESILRLESDHGFGPKAYYLWGESLRYLERYEEALGPLQKAADLTPENASVWLALGWCHKRTVQISLAIRDMESALEHAPAAALLHYNLACYLSLERHRQRAMFHLAQALTLNGNYRTLIDSESDFDPIRSDPEFQALTSTIV